MNEIYFDNAATTKPSSAVVEQMVALLTTHYGNPSSLHKKGIEAEKHIEECRTLLSHIWKVSPHEIYFTSGGTEANNIGILGCACGAHRSGKHIITTTLEHPSVSEPIRYLQQQGFEVTYLPVDEYGYIDPDTLQKSIRTDTVLVTIMHINNEVGTMQPLEQLGAMIKQANPTTKFHVDAVQSFGKYPLSLQRSNIDLLGVSGHKIHGPKGIGALYIKKGVKLSPRFFGGQQQKGIRPGTENVPGIGGFKIAIQEAFKNSLEHTTKVMGLKQSLSASILSQIPRVKINGPRIEEGSAYILNMGFEDIRGEVLLHALEQQNIYVSTGSACSTRKPQPSSTLQAMGVDLKYSTGAIRFSFSSHNTMQEVEQCITVLKHIIPRLRKYV